MKNPSRALIAYSLIAKHLHRGDSSPDIEQALMEFFRAMAYGMQKEKFDPEKFSQEARRQFGINIPIPIAQSWAPRLEKAGILTATSVRRVGKDEYKEYAYAAFPVNQQTDNGLEIEAVFDAFRKYCRDELGSMIEGFDDAQIDDAFLQRLLHLESLKIFAKRHRASVGAKRTKETLILSKRIPTEEVDMPTAETKLDALLDVAVADFLINAEQDQPKLFQQINSLAYSNLAVETLLAFVEPPSNGHAFASAQVFFDTRLVLDMMHLNLDREQYGAEFKEMVAKAKIEPCIFQHSLVEIEEIIHARLLSNSSPQLLSNSSPQRFSSHIEQYRAEPPQMLERLRSINGAVELELNRIGIAVIADEPMGMANQRQKVTASQAKDIEEKLKSSGWAENVVARDRDVRSVCDIISLRHSQRNVDDIQDVPYILVTSNTTLAGVANNAWRNWLIENQTFNVSAKAPIAISDIKLAGLIWITCGAPLEGISRARLIANCANALRPTEEATKSVYNMIVDAQGTDDAERFAAIMTDQRAQRMFMKQTAGEPKFMAPNNLPQFLDDLQASLIGEKTREFNEKERELRFEAAKLAEKVQEAENVGNAAKFALSQRIAADKDRLSHLIGDRERVKRIWYLGISGAVAVAMLGSVQVLSFLVDAFGYTFFEATKWILNCIVTVVGTWKIPDLLFSDFCDRKANQYFSRKAEEADVSYLLSQTAPNDPKRIESDNIPILKLGGG